MRLFCIECGKSVSSELPAKTIVRAICICPECIERKDAAQQSRALDAAETCDCGEPFPENGYCKFCGARQRQRQ